MLGHLEGKPPWAIILLCLVGTLSIGIADQYAGPEIAWAVFYVLPVGVGAWYGGRGPGVAIALATAITWLIADEWSGGRYFHPLAPYWNTLVRVSLFLIVAYLLSGLKERLLAEQQRASTDPLTQLSNNRAFYERVQAEIERSSRYGHPFTVAYIDLDNFKAVNDAHGHAAGDAVLLGVADVLRRFTRRSDAAARLGGDEFALLLIETTSQQGERALESLQRHLLTAVQEMRCPVTFSIGAITCKTPPKEAMEVIRLADETMYRVKKEGKNGLAVATFANPPIKEVG